MTESLRGKTSQQGTLKQLVYRSYSRHRRKFITAMDDIGIQRLPRRLVPRFVEDKFSTVTKKMGDSARFEVDVTLEEMLFPLFSKG